MTKEEFKQRWESSDSGGGITDDIVAACAIEWGIVAANMDTTLYLVLKEANTTDFEEFTPEK